MNSQNRYTAFIENRFVCNTTYFFDYKLTELQYTLLQNGRHFSILLFTYKLALVASFKGKYRILLNFEFKDEATRANLQVNKRTLKGWPFWSKVYTKIRFSMDKNTSVVFVNPDEFSLRIKRQIKDYAQHVSTNGKNDWTQALTSRFSLNNNTKKRCALW